ncbi:TOBE domain-containing protein [Desulfomonile tiedjei]|uniref:Molybdenum-pterin binding domain protein n=1 Tax=Desulfomonile tiedjei (strain ATCC 49306 / DSM 6799 / DCB-1) TaxID=706587 RepID=I4C5D1_DESTA|nr:TOBE domain-containing protein [Desulfomonile tiedjei]AFM24772.1 molybdenum-pterin binding domain protein [Desulfomonile tiedjei DSM 6799]
MQKGKNKRSDSSNLMFERADFGLLNPARIYAPGETKCLDPTELASLEQSFRSWAQDSPRTDVRASRKRILLIFLLIRYTGARLNEVLALDLSKHIDIPKQIVRFRDADEIETSQREVQISSELISEIQEIMTDLDSQGEANWSLRVDAAHVRRKFYERAVQCGFAQDLGSPNAIRRARAVELMQSNMPLPVVQRVLGHSTPNLTASLVDFSQEEVRQVERHFIEKESRRKTSARNTFFGKISTIQKGDIQSQVELVTIGGDIITTVITNNSLNRLGIKQGSLIAAEVKAPWVILQKAKTKPSCTAENMLHGTVTQILRGKLTTEFTVRIQDGTDLCSLVTEESRRRLAINEGDKVWVVFNSFAVILRAD